MSRPITFLPCLILAVTATAQAPCPRTPVQLSSGAVTASSVGFRAWKVVAPKDELPSDPARGLMATARVAYAVWIDLDGGGNLVVRFVRSADGGFSWDLGRAVDIWTNAQAGGERMFANEIGFAADGHSVWVAIRSNRRPTRAAPTSSDENLWVIGSPDQGQTWQAVCATVGLERPLSTRDQLRDVDGFAIAAAGGDCHLVFEADYLFAAGVNGQSQIHDAYYQAVGFDAAGQLVRRFAEERALTGQPTGTIDTDLPSIAASGRNVICAWQDDRAMPNNNAVNNTYSRVSNDGGATFGPEHDHTGFNGTQPVNQRRSYAAADGANLYVFQEDHRNFTEDDVYLSISNDAGRTWNDGVVVSLSPQGVDSDGVVFACVDGRIYVAYADDRNGRGNGNNDVFLVADRNAGADFVAGIHGEVQLTTDPRNNYPVAIDAVGDVVALTYDEDDARGDGAYVTVSVDGGASFRTWTAQTGNGSDTDDPWVAVTRARDVAVVWADDGGVNNLNNKAWIAGLKVPYLVDRTATGGNLELTGHTAAEVGNLVLLLGSLGGPASNGVPLAPDRGLYLNLLPDSLALAMAGNFTAFLTSVAGDTATWSLPRFSSLIGADIWYAAAEIDVQTGRPSLVHSDPLLQRR
jgi:hypothetical protein